ncbi:MAG: 50S ribosomal protein L10 [Candidatus Bilamarchaeaceae archaeon]
MAKADIKRPAVKKKAEEVNKTLNEMKSYKTVALILLEKLPDALFQAIRKKIRENGGKVVVLRKAVLSRVLQSNSKLAARVKDAEKPCALVLTNWSPYQLNKLLKESTKKRAAKVGEIAPFDIVVPAGETDLPPGPALSELKGAGVNAQIKAGKIVVAADSVVAKTGEKINAQKAKALQTLGIKPFTIRANLLFGYDGEYVYEKELLDLGDTIARDLTAAMTEAFNLSVNAGYPTRHNIDALLKEAYIQSVNLAVNGKLYSIVSIDQVLLSALLEGEALSKVVPVAAQSAAEQNPAQESKSEVKT